MAQPKIDSLIAVLREGSYEQRKDATQELVALGDAAVEALIDIMRMYSSREAYEREVMEDANPAQHYAVECLIEIGEPAVDPLIDALRDTTWGARMGAIYCLGAIGEPRAVQPLIELLGEDWGKQDAPIYDIGESLKRIGEIAMRPLIFALRQHQNARVRYGAATIMESYSDPLVVKALSDTAREDESSDVRGAAILSLRMIGDESAITVMIDALADSAAENRELAAVGLGNLLERATDEQARGTGIAALVRVMREDDDWGARQTAAEKLATLQTLHAEEAVDRLVLDLSDPDPEIRLGAGWSLLPLNDTRAVDPLTRLLTHSDARIVRMAAAALGRFGDPRPIPILNALLSSPNEDIRHAANDALQALSKNTET